MAENVALPAAQVGAEAFGNSVQSMDMTITGMFMNADLVVKAVMLGLLLSSVWCWAIIIDKWLLYRRLKKKTDQFEQSFWSGEQLDRLYDRVRSIADNPMAIIFVAAMHEWTRKREKSAEGIDQSLKVGLKERIFQAMSVIRNREMGKLEKNLGFLATTGSTAPFVGLFGTVWGIMNSFTSIAMTKNTTLAVVAPGIAEALLATAVGLFAAIPAVIFYNKYTIYLNEFSGQLDDFSDELGAIISRRLDESTR